MICPRCGNELDASRKACTNCGYIIRMAGQTGSPSNFTASQWEKKQSVGLPPANQYQAILSPTPTNPGEMPPNIPHSNPQNATTRIPPRGSSMASSTPISANSSLSRPAFEKNMLRRVPTGREPDARQPVHATDLPHTDVLSFQNTLQHTQRPVQNTPPVERPPRKMEYPQAPAPPQQQMNTYGVAAPSREGERTRSHSSYSPSSFTQATPTSIASIVQTVQPTTATTFRPNSTPVNVRPLLPGVLLRGGRYRLQELRERQEWLPGIFEAIWTAQDSHRSSSQVMVDEVVLPDNTSSAALNVMRNATMNLISVGRHPRIPALWDAFSDQGRSFFVFEPTEGESLLSRMRRIGRVLPEQEVVECCLQMAEVLELLAQQSPPFVHGLIRPEHIKVGRNGAQFVLTNFSVVLAGGATQFVTGIENSRLSPYSAPEFSRGVIDVRSDLYSLLATAYYVVTGNAPVAVNGSIPLARNFNPSVTLQFDAILAKGMRSLPNQRYQRPSELRQDLLSIRSVSGSVISGSSTFAPGNTPYYPDNAIIAANNTISSSGNSTLTSRGTEQSNRNNQHVEPPPQRIPDSVSEALPMMLASSGELEERPFLLPMPEALPPLKETNDRRNATILISIILLSFLIIVVLSHLFG